MSRPARPLIPLVRSHHDAYALLKRFLDLLEQFDTCRCIDPSEGLIEQQELRPANPGSRKQYTTHLPVRQLAERSGKGDDSPGLATCDAAGLHNVRARI